MPVYAVDKLISQARRLAAEYRQTTGRPLPGISVEIAHYDAAYHLDLELCPGQQTGIDAIGKGNREAKRIQIKGRAIFDNQKSGQRIGQLRLDQGWDSVVLVLLDEEFNAFEIYEAERANLEEAIKGNKSNRSKRGALSVAKFKVLGRLVWTKDDGKLDGDVWTNR